MKHVFQRTGLAVLPALLAIGSFARAEGLTEAKVIYQTTTDDKDAHTAVSAELVFDQHTVAVDSGHNNRRWGGQSLTNPFDMQINEATRAPSVMIPDIKGSCRFR